MKLPCFVKTLSFLLVLACASGSAQVTHAVVLGQVDGFEDGTTMGWSEGAPSPNPPANIANGGPLGPGDNYVQNDSAGGGGPGGRMVMFNEAQWSGDYSAAGVTGISLDMINLGATPLSMRIALRGGASTQYGSTNAFALPADGQWYAASFGLTASDLSLISGGDSLAAVLADVDTLRILSAAGGPVWRGDRVDGTLGVDNITAVPEPASLSLAALAGLALLRRRRRTGK